MNTPQPVSLKLSAPFILVEAVTQRFICSSTGDPTLADIPLYIDPMSVGKYSAAVPGFIAAFAVSPSICFDRGEFYVTENSAQAAAETLSRLFRDYFEAVHCPDRAEVIAYRFQGVAPTYCAKGEATGDYAFKMPGVQYSDEAGVSTQIELHFVRRWAIGCGMYVKTADGELQRDLSLGDYQSIAYTEQAWNSLVAVRATLTKAVAMLGALFGSNDITALLANIGSRQSSFA